MTVEEMASHFFDLCEEHDVEMEYYTGAGRAFPSDKFIRIRPIKGISTYYVALHELAHCIAPGRKARKLEAEALMWQWAIDNAKRPPTPGVRKMIARCLQGYLDAGRRGWGRRQNMREPDPDHVFWTLLKY